MSTTLKHLTRLALLGLGCMVISTGCSRQARTEARLEKANKYYASGQYDQAEIEYLNVLRKDRTNRAAIRQLGLMASDQGNLVQAYGLLTNAVAANPADLVVREKLAQVLLAAGDPRRAREQALFILGKQPTNEAATVLLADTAITPKELDDTRTRLVTLRAQAEETSGYYLALGSLILRTNNLTGAEAAFRKAVAVNPTSIAAHLGLAGLLWNRKDLKGAEEQFKQASDLAPPRSMARLRYADFKIANEDVAGGRKALEAVVAQAPDYVPALVRLAQLALAEGKHDEGEGLIKKAVSRDSANLQVRLLGVQLALLKNEPDQALREMETTAKIFAGAPLVHYQLARTYLINNNLPKAITSLQQAVALNTNYVDASMMLAEINLRRGEAAQAVTDLTRLVRVNTNYVPGYLMLATAYRAQRDYSNALRIYQAVAAARPTNAQPTYLCGLVQREQTNHVAARTSFEQALQLDPGYRLALEQLIMLDIADKNYSSALRRAQTEAQRDPKSPSAQLLIAGVYMVQTNYAATEAALQKALAIAPDYAPAQSQLARVYVATKRTDEAVAKLTALAAKHTNDLGALLQIALIHSAASNYSKARDAYEKLLTVNPRLVPALNNLAYLYSEHLGDLKRAAELGRKCRELAPSDPASADTLGWILFRRGELPQALTLLKESAEKLPNEPEIQYHLGMTHYSLGEEQPARVALQDALRLSQAFPGREVAEQRLAFLNLDPNSTDPKLRAGLDQELSRNPNDPVVLSRLAAICEREGDLDKAVLIYERALKANPNSVALMVRLAALYSGPRRNPAKALELARAAHALAPEDARISHTLGRLASQDGDHTWALSLLTESARKLPGDADVQLDLATAQFSLGQIASASASAQKALALGPNLARAQEARNLLSFLSVISKPDTAKASASMIQDAVKKYPDYTPALAAAACLEEQQGNFTAARDLYEKLLQRLPGFILAHRQLALLYSDRLKDPKKAFESATKARDAFPADPDVAKALGILVYERKDYARAAQLLTEASPKRATDAELLYYLGMAHYQLKQRDQSKAALNKAIALNLSAPLAAEAKRALADLK